MDVLTTTQAHLLALSRSTSNVTFLSLFIDAAVKGVVEIINKFRQLRSLAL
jgi:hypothetical protein